MPQRIQLRRSKGWTMPAGAVKVDRSSSFGNPYRIDLAKDIKNPAKNEWWINSLDGGSVYRFKTKAEAQDAAVRLFRHAMTEHMKTKVRLALKGKDLACWCAPGTPCHADFLLEIANNAPKST